MWVQVLGKGGLYEFRLWGGFGFNWDVWGVEGSRFGLWDRVRGISSCWRLRVAVAHELRIAFKSQTPKPGTLYAPNIGAFIIRIGLWGILYHNHNKEPPKSYSNY